MFSVSVLGAAGSRPGKLGRYELITQIGQGGMAEVQLALQRGPAGFEKLVVVKLVHQNLATQKAFVDMLLDEARVAALVKHPNVVDIYDLGEADGRYFIAMEYLEGEPLLAVLRAGREGKRLDTLSTARLIADTAEGLDAAHELRSMSGDPIELVHHDVSLGNIVVLYNGQVKLVDFGVAKATQKAAGPATKVQGKFSYMAPEKLRGGRGDRRSDIWSLGCVLWEALTLRRLFKGGNDADTMKQVLEAPMLPPSKVNGDVPREFDAIVMKALERDPAKRYATAKAMAVDLEEVLRKGGYSGRNDAIAKYMLATFGEHITARKKLLQEVSSKGRASADVLEAAFAEPLTPAHINASGEFSMRIARPSNELRAEGTPQVKPTGSAAIPIIPPDNEATVIDDRAPVIEIEVGGNSELELTGVTEAAPANRRMLILALAGGAALLIVLVVVIAIVGKSHSGGNKIIDQAAGTGDPTEVATATPTPTPTPAPPPSPQPPPPETGSGSEQAAAAASGSGSGSETEIEIKPDHVRPPPPPRPAASAETLYRQGVQAWALGNTSGALAAYKQAQAANPRYAPTYRGLGNLYEKAGNKSAARSAYQRYLALAPGASDAEMIKKKLEDM
jgi:eukaryotic-like serine/threonine-protein kinase